MTRPAVALRSRRLLIKVDASAHNRTAATDVAEWKSASQPVEKTAAADACYARHKADIEAKRADDMQKWDRTLPQDKPVLTLHADDGV